MLMVDGPEGYRAVLAAMDYFKLVKGERVRFYSLLDALMTDEADLAFKRDVMLFINTLVNRCAQAEAFFEKMKNNLSHEIDFFFSLLKPFSNRTLVLRTNAL